MIMVVATTAIMIMSNSSRSLTHTLLVRSYLHRNVCKWRGIEEVRSPVCHGKSDL